MTEDGRDEVYQVIRSSGNQNVGIRGTGYPEKVDAGDLFSVGGNAI